MGDHGENFAGLVKSILSNPQNADAYKAWLKQLTPAELDDVMAIPGAEQDTLFAFRKNSHTFSARVLSDGTLRFAAIAAAFFQSEMPDVLMIEEIEDGIHPTRLRLLLDLLKSQSIRTGTQVIVTTHSPLVLAWLSGEDYKSTFLFKKDDETGASTITPLSSIPRFAELAHKYSAAELFAEGWLEGSL